MSDSQLAASGQVMAAANVIRVVELEIARALASGSPPKEWHLPPSQYVQVIKELMRRAPKQPQFVPLEVRGVSIMLRYDGER